jgi:hypothetical protein
LIDGNGEELSGELTLSSKLAWDLKALGAGFCDGMTIETCFFLKDEVFWRPFGLLLLVFSASSSELFVSGTPEGLITPLDLVDRCVDWFVIFTLLFFVSPDFRPISMVGGFLSVAFYVFFFSIFYGVVLDLFDFDPIDFVGDSTKEERFKLEVDFEFFILFGEAFFKMLIFRRLISRLSFLTF